MLSGNSGQLVWDMVPTENTICPNSNTSLDEIVYDLVVRQFLED
jgi:hypothetical protein